MPAATAKTRRPLETTHFPCNMFETPVRDLRDVPAWSRRHDNGISSYKSFRPLPPEAKLLDPEQVLKLVP